MPIIQGVGGPSDRSDDSHQPPEVDKTAKVVTKHG